MCKTEKSLLTAINRGGCTIMGEDKTPTMVSGLFKQNGNTQDGLSVVVGGAEHD